MNFYAILYPYGKYTVSANTGKPIANLYGFSDRKSRDSWVAKSPSDRNERINGFREKTTVKEAISLKLYPYSNFKTLENENRLYSINWNEYEY